MKKVLLGLVLSIAALASGDPKDYDDRVTQSGLEGTWCGVSGEDNGQPIPAAQIQGAKLIFKRDLTGTLFDQGMRAQALQYRTDSTRRPAHLDLTMLDAPGKGETLRMIYSIEGDTLKLALYVHDHAKRPTDLKTGAGSNVRLLVLKREGN
jgi:uncharacterized protein (TIGR03067 family)